LACAAQTQDSKTTYQHRRHHGERSWDRRCRDGRGRIQHDNGLTSLHQRTAGTVLGSYLFPQVIGIGKFQVLGKYSDLTNDATTATLHAFVPDQDHEVNVNYIIKEFSARVGMYYLNQKNDLGRRPRRKRIRPETATADVSINWR
jgi:hypothetical protein